MKLERKKRNEKSEAIFFFWHTTIQGFFFIWHTAVYRCLFLLSAVFGMKWTIFEAYLCNNRGVLWCFEFALSCDELLTAVTLSGQKELVPELWHCSLAFPTLILAAPAGEHRSLPTG